VIKSRSASLHLVPPPPPRVRRRLTPEAGRGLEILGHAIEYLEDEYPADSVALGVLPDTDAQLEAIDLLKALNREIYFSAAEVQPPFHRVRQWFLSVWASQ
jgi:hypothetical protein